VVEGGLGLGLAALVALVVASALWRIAIDAIDLGGRQETVSDILQSTPDFRGSVTGVSPGDGDDVLGVLNVSDRASVRVTGNTRILLGIVGYGGSGPLQGVFEDISVGQQVDVWFAGAVEEGPPIEAEARWVYVRD
jgi:hypothetical protein